MRYAILILKKKDIKFFDKMGVVGRREIEEGELSKCSLSAVLPNLMCRILEAAVLVVIRVLVG